MSPPESLDWQVVIIGGGVVGCCTAYYLTRHPLFSRERCSITILEASNIASGSSGKAGGLIASWAGPGCLSPTSFTLHSELAAAHDGSKHWGYRRVTSADCVVNFSSQAPESDSSTCAGLPSELGWVRRQMFESYSECGNHSNTAQVHPRLFTESMWRLATEASASTIFGSAIRINKSANVHKVRSVSYVKNGETEERELPASHVVVAAGPWTSSIIPEANVGGAKSHSVIVRPQAVLSGNTLEVKVKNGPDDAPAIVEIYPRPDGTLYACAFCEDEVPLPSKALEVDPDKNKCSSILKVIQSMSAELTEGAVEIGQACFQPVVLRDGKRQRCVGPIISTVSTEGLILATAHDSWGIQNAPGTGKAVSELIVDGVSRCVDLEYLKLDGVLDRARKR